MDIYTYIYIWRNKSMHVDEGKGKNVGRGGGEEKSNGGFIGAFLPSVKRDLLPPDYNERGRGTEKGRDFFFFLGRKRS